MSEHTAWAWSECVVGAIDQRRESARKRRRRAHKGGQEEEPRGGLTDLQSSPAFRPQTFLQNALGDLNSPANLRRSRSLLPPQVQAPAKTSAVCCLADALALPWAHHCSISASGKALQCGGDCSCLPAWGQGAILNYYYNCLMEEPDCVSINSLFPISCIPRIMTLKKDWDLLKYFRNCVTWEGNMGSSCCEFDAIVIWRRNTQLMSNPKTTWL